MRPHVQYCPTRLPPDELTLTKWTFKHTKTVNHIVCMCIDRFGNRNLGPEYYRDRKSCPVTPLAPVGALVRFTARFMVLPKARLLLGCIQNPFYCAIYGIC